MTQAENMVYGIIEQIIQTKTDAVVPCAAHMDEINHAVGIEIKEALRSLCRSGVLSFRLNVNKNPMFIINRQPQ